MTDHLDDLLLDAYCDAALPPSERAAVDAHLAACPDCQARVAAWRALFAAVEALPEAALTRDLSAAVTAGLPAPRVLEPAGLRAWRWVVAAQAALAGLLLALAAPLALAGLPPLEPAQFGAPLLDLLAGLAQEAQALASDLTLAVADGWQAAQGLAAPAAALPVPLLGGALAALLVFWLIGNGLLLRQAGGAVRPPAAPRSS